MKNNSSKLTILLLLCSAVCWGMFNLIGSTVDEQGFLREPFFLIPLGWLFIFLAMVSGLVTVVGWAMRKRAN
jgi:hypothetical protein